MNELGSTEIYTSITLSSEAQRIMMSLSLQAAFTSCEKLKATVSCSALILKTFSQRCQQACLQLVTEMLLWERRWAHVHKEADVWHLDSIAKGHAYPWALDDSAKHSPVLIRTQEHSWAR